MKHISEFLTKYKVRDLAVKSESVETKFEVDQNRKYKVEFVQTEKFVIDVVAKSEAEAIELAKPEWERVAENGTYHYHQSQEAEVEVGIVYDVTNTDDSFDPVNCIHSECDQEGDCKICGVNVLSTNNGI